MIRRASNDNRGILPDRRRRDWRVYVIRRRTADLLRFNPPVWLLTPPLDHAANDFRHPDRLPVEPPTASGNVNRLLWEKRNAHKADRAQPMRYFIQKADQTDDTPPA